MGTRGLSPKKAERYIIPYFFPFDNALEVKRVKFSKGALAGLAVTAALLCLWGGWFLRGLAGDSYRVEGEHPPREPTAYPSDFTPDDPVDLNAAGLSELMALPGLGRVRAQAILDYREANGPFTYPEDVIGVPGIGMIIYEGISDYVTTSQP